MAIYIQLEQKCDNLLQVRLKNDFTHYNTNF